MHTYKNFKSAGTFKKYYVIKLLFYIFSLLVLLIFLIIFNLIISLSIQSNLYAQETNNNINEVNDKTVSKTPFIFPLDGRVNLSFREDYFDLEKNTARKHTGIDIAGEFNQDVAASGNGIVVYVGFSPIGGRTIVIKHNEKIRTTYLNLLSIFVSPGDYVHQGDVIAAIGAADDPSSFKGSHLHFGIIYNDFYLDPLDVLKISYKSISGYISLKYLENDFYLK